MKAILRFACLTAALSLCVGDVYMHNPRGSNNRLNERSANRNNADRLFDSQNNNRGGYNAGDSLTSNTGFSSESQIYHMKFFQSTNGGGKTSLTVEWTNQHGCGGNEDTDPWKPNCNIVIQYMVQDNVTLTSANVATRIHDGTATTTQTYTPPSNRYTDTYADYYNNRVSKVTDTSGLHESFDYYDDCYMRTRNKGLFTADQNLGTNKRGISSAIYTRQNPNGNQRGYECPEERDYYPYWHPSPWIDAAVLTDNTSRCAYYQSESFNVQPKGLCRQNFSDTGATRPWSEFNNYRDCITNGGNWWVARSYIEVQSITQTQCQQKNNTDGYLRYWDVTSYGGTPTCLVAPKAPDCKLGDWSRVNHLGNGRSGVPLNYTWTIPYFPSGNNKIIVVRLRYNISTDDYNPWATNASLNQNPAQRTISPVTQNPYINIGSTTNKPLRLAINTAQFGRTFQDRSHLTELMPRPSTPAALGTCNIYNINVRGKRGNIVQTFPAVEYDFIPNRLTVSKSDCVHIQWTGSNTHNNGNPAGDGQAGDAGEGLTGTDRSNVLQAPTPSANYPTPWEQSTMFNNPGLQVLWVPPYWTKAASAMIPLDVGVAYASVGNFQCYTGCTYSASPLNGVYGAVDPLLNTVSASFDGLVLQFAPGNYYYLCSRNNNFSNRSQKGQLTVTA